MLLSLAAERRVLFVGGKGGVGKTAIASSVALARARAGAQVLLVSTDPAHSLGHLWQRPVGDEVVPLGVPGLHGMEIDPATTTREHLAEVGRTLDRLVPEHLRAQVRRHLDLARDAPGTHEAALLERVAMIVADELERFDLVVFDTAPAGHTARLVQLPETIALWTQGMLHSHDRSQRMTAALGGLDPEDPGHAVVVGSGRGISRPDRDAEIRHVLLRRQQRFTHLREVLLDPQQTAFVIVLLGERLPALETVELAEQLRETGMDVAALVVNKRSPLDAGALLAQRHRQEAEHIAYVREQLPGVPLLEVPLLARDLAGRESLEEVVAAISGGAG